MILRCAGVAFLAVLLTPNVAHAWCDPNRAYTPRAEFGSSIFVGVVQVVHTTWLDDHRRPTTVKPGSVPSGFDPYAGALYRARVLKQYKGMPRRVVTVFSENTSGRTPLRYGTKYVVFLYRAEVGDEYDRKGDLMIDYCGNSTDLSRAGALTTMLARLAKTGVR